jgi:hypothetical protein
MQRLATALGGALTAVVLTAGSVFAAPSYKDTVVGVEIAATATQGTFVGSAGGGLPGSWEAVVDHTPLNPSATITGGSFVLQTRNGGRIDGAFAPGGAVSLLSGGTGCSNQTYAVRDELTITTGGTGTFAVLLTHYRTTLFGACVTYGASVEGSLTLPG